MGRSYINRVRRSPPGDSSPLFDRYPRGVQRDKVGDAERKATIDFFINNALMKYDSKKRQSFVYYDSSSEFYDLYVHHMGDVISCVLALIQSGAVDPDDDLSSFMSRNLQVVEEFAETFCALENLFSFLPSNVVSIIASYLSPALVPRSRTFFDQLKISSKVHHAHKSFLACQCQASVFLPLFGRRNNQGHNVQLLLHARPFCVWLFVHGRDVSGMT